MAEQQKKRKKGERADGRIQARVNIGRDEKGKIKYKYFYGRTLKEANAKAEAYKLDLLNYGRPLDTNSTTLSEWTYKHLFTNVYPTVSASTFERYMTTYNNHIRGSYVGNMNVQEIQQVHLQNYLNTKTSLSKSSIKKIYELLNNSFKSAIANNLIRLNPLDSVKLPSSEVKPKSIEILTLAEQKAYINALENSGVKMILFTLLNTGMRVGEAMALKWDNVDLTNATITVCENIKKVKQYDTKGNSKNILITKSPKTEKGNRLLPIPKFLVNELKRFKLSSHKSKDGLVFCSRNGTPLEYNTIRRAHVNICKKAEIRPYELMDDEGNTTIQYKGVSLHALRHTFATRMIENGVDVKTVSELLGHASIEITLNTYVHSTNEAKRKAIDTMEQMYEGLI